MFLMTRTLRITNSHVSMMPWLALSFGDKRAAKLKLAWRWTSIPHLAVLRKDGAFATYDGISLINKYGVSAFTSLLKTEDGFLRSYAPLKVSFDYYELLKDKYRRELDAKDEENKDKWDELPIRPSLRKSGMSGVIPEEPENPYEKRTFILSKPLSKPPVNYDDIIIPTAMTQIKKAKGNFPS